jgi:predicted PurR-regulated permease PerM
VADPSSSEIPRWLARASAYGWRFLVLVATLVVVFTALGRIRLVVTPIIFALFLTAILAPPAQWLRRHKWPPLAATWAVFLLGVAVLVGLGIWFVPKVANQFGDVGKQASQGFKDVQRWLTHKPFNLKQSDIDKYINSITNGLSSRQGQIVQGAFKGVSVAIEVVTTALLTFVLTFFFVKDGELMTKWFVGLVAPNRADEVRELGRRSWEALGGYIRGTAVNGLVNGTVMGITLAVVGVPLALPLAFLTFVGAFIPLVGAIVTGVLAALIALVAKGGVAALVVIGATIVVHNLEGYLVGPFVLGRAVHLHPVAILLALTTGTILGGALGAFLAVPVLSIVIAVIGYYRSENAHVVAAAADDDGGADEPEPLQRAAG